MKISELQDPPQWLLDAKTSDADVVIEYGCVIWHGGVWYGGDWHGGDWRGGDWRGGEDRVLYMAALLGLVAGDSGELIGYRSTHQDGRGRYNTKFVQSEGEYYERDCPPAGSGTCVKGIHVSSAVIAWNYFGVDPTAQLWRVRFRRENLLDCDGQKARIDGGYFEKIPWPFIKEAKP